MIRSPDQRPPSSVPIWHSGATSPLAHRCSAPSESIRCEAVASPLTTTPQQWRPLRSASSRHTRAVAAARGATGGHPVRALGLPMRRRVVLVDGLDHQGDLLWCAPARWSCHPPRGCRGGCDDVGKQRLLTERMRCGPRHRVRTHQMLSNGDRLRSGAVRPLRTPGEPHGCWHTAGSGSHCTFVRVGWLPGWSASSQKGVAPVQ
jgi:hypothetical protein